MDENALTVHVALPRDRVRSALPGGRPSTGGPGDRESLFCGTGQRPACKTGWLETDNEAYRTATQQVPLYSRALSTGLPFPKTRRIVFLNNQPATLPGWAVLEVG